MNKKQNPHEIRVLLFIQFLLPAIMIDSVISKPYGTQIKITAILWSYGI